MYTVEFTQEPKLIMEYATTWNKNYKLFLQFSNKATCVVVFFFTLKIYILKIKLCFTELIWDLGEIVCLNYFNIVSGSNTCHLSQTNLVISILLSFLQQMLVHKILEVLPRLGSSDGYSIVPLSKVVGSSQVRAMNA